MLKYSEYSFDEIAQILAYRSQSHFSGRCSKTFRHDAGEYRTKYAQNGIWPSIYDHGVYHAGCGEPPVTAPRNSGVPIVKSTCPRVRNTRESATVEAFNDDARHRP